MNEALNELIELDEQGEYNFYKRMPETVFNHPLWINTKFFGLNIEFLEHRVALFTCPQYKGKYGANRGIPEVTYLYLKWNLTGKDNCL